MTHGAAEYRAVYDTDLRMAAEVRDAIDVVRRGPVLIGVYRGGSALATYRDLGGADADEVQRLVAEVMEAVHDDRRITTLEWKTRGHDHAPGLEAALTAAGLVAGDVETVMMGSAKRLAELPSAVEVRQATERSELEAMEAAAMVAFGVSAPAHNVDRLLDLIARDAASVWIAEAGGDVIGGGRLEPVEGSVVAGLWGGFTSPAHRGAGVYRALVAARARAALEAGRTIMHSDSTDASRPILQGWGCEPVTTTTPWEWRRPEAR